MNLNDQAKGFADKVMGMNRADRRRFAKQNNIPKIYGSTKPFIRKDKFREATH